jgi:hypothetical protein
VEDERRSSNGARQSKQDERQMGMTYSLRPALVDIWVCTVVEGAQIQYDEACNSECKEGFMASLEYRGYASLFTTLGSNDAPLSDTKLHPLSCGTVNDRSFVVPLVTGCLLVSGRVVSLLLYDVRTEEPPRYSNLVIKLYICFLGSLHVS